MSVVWPVVCATGHRALPNEDWVEPELRRVAAKLRDEHGTTVGISGMAIGADMAWARAVLAAGLELWAYMPCPQQADRWPRTLVAEWRRLRGLAAREKFFGDHYEVRFLHARNHGMLDDSAGTVAVWMPASRSGGTWGAVQEAAQRDRTMVHVDPVAMRTGWLKPDRVLDGRPRRHSNRLPNSEENQMRLL